MLRSAAGTPRTVPAPSGSASDAAAVSAVAGHPAVLWRRLSGGCLLLGLRRVAHVRRSLSFRCVLGMDSSCLEYLPSSITQLIVCAERRHMFGGDDTPCALPAQLQQLTSLLQLTVQKGAVSPALLAGFTKLQQLALQECRLLPSPDADGRQTDGATALLEVLPKLQQLQLLQLYLTPPALYAVPPQRFSALTASSQLTYLELQARGVPLLPQGAVQHMFPARRQLSQLQCLTLSGTDYYNGDDHDDYIGDAWGLRASDLSSIVTCCPGLTALSLVHAVDIQDLDMLPPLLQLPLGCRTLHFGGVPWGDLQPVLGQLTQLHNLKLSDIECLEDLDLETLTALTGLTALVLSNCAQLSEELVQLYGGEDIVLQGGDLEVSAAWQQLVELMHSGIV